MPYRIFITVENQDDADSAPNKAWWSVNEYDSLDEALEDAQDMCNQYAARHGIFPERFDNDKDDDE